MFVLTAVAVAATACKQEIVQKTPLQVENGGSIENRLMVSEDAADNSRCHVCHINYDEEELALNHELGDVRPLQSLVLTSAIKLLSLYITRLK